MEGDMKEQFDAVALTAIYDLNCLCDDILRAARYATGKGYVITMTGFNYRLTPYPSARLHVVTPTGESYAALIKFLEPDGWTLDHKIDWHRLGVHIMP